MKIRVVQIWGFLQSVLGWIFVACTMAMEGWKISAVGGMGGSAIIKVAWYWSSLWRSCFTDSTAVFNCRDFGILWSVEFHVQIVRGLLMGALSLGMLGFVLSLLGMECTYIGGKDLSKHRKIYAGGCCHIISGALSAAGYGVYAQYVSIEYFNPNFTGQKFDLGTPLFLGWVGSAFHMAGGFFYLWSVCKPLCGGKKTTIKVQMTADPEKNESTKDLSSVSEMTSKSKMSSISELSSRSRNSDVSSISSKSEGTSRSGRTTGSGRTTRSGRSTGRPSRSRGSDESTSSIGSESMPLSSLASRSRQWSRSSLSTSLGSRSSVETGSSRLGSIRRQTAPFVQNSYI